MSICPSSNSLNSRPPQAVDHAPPQGPHGYEAPPPPPPPMPSHLQGGGDRGDARHGGGGGGGGGVGRGGGGGAERPIVIYVQGTPGPAGPAGPAGPGPSSSLGQPRLQPPPPPQQPQQPQQGEPPMPSSPMQAMAQSLVRQIPETHATAQVGQSIQAPSAAGGIIDPTAAIAGQGVHPPGTQLGGTLQSVHVVDGGLHNPNNPGTGHTPIWDVAVRPDKPVNPSIP